MPTSVSQRLAVLILACAGASPAWPQRFSPGGPDADAYGRKEGYPHCSRLTYLNEPRCRVGAFSHFDALYPARTVQAPATPSPLRRSAEEPPLRYLHNGRTESLDTYLSRHRVTGLLVAQGDTILAERYQYARNDKHRLTSFSMAKTITALLVGIAVHEGAIRSIDDPAEAYAPALRGTEYGRTSIKALLHMASGVAFDENYGSPTSDIYRLAFTAIGEGSVTALRQFDQRAAKPGERFSYSSAETLVLGLVLTGATGRSVAEYASEKLWKPLGAEADASWMIDPQGQEITFAYFNAVLRDYARLGLMLAHDGAWHGKQVVPAQWVKDGTARGVSSGYGYQVWLLATQRPTFQLKGLRGQFVFVDPLSKTVLVQTALRDDAEGHAELFNLWRALIGEP
jgi:CubicO group peptidase (beta-lactamase class C family)